MDQELQKFDNEDKAIQVVIEDKLYGEDRGYRWWYEIQLMDGTTYKVSPVERESVINSLDRAKFIQLGENIIATHQIKGIFKKTEVFGPRSGGLV